MTKSLFHRFAAMLITAVMMLGAVPVTASADGIERFLDNQRWNDFIDEKMAQDKTPGMTLAAVNGEENGFRAWGYADIADKTPFTETTPFRIGSCSKAFTALSVLLLQEEGKLSIEDSVSDYIPWWHVTYQGRDADVKIWHLLEHCSGIPNSTMMKMPIGHEDALFEETVRIAEDLELVREPGSEFEYCNLGYDILAYITQTVSGMPFEDYMEQEIFRPIGMTHSGYDLPTAQGYRRFFGRPAEYDAPFFRGGYGDGELVSTGEDMQLWLMAQLGHLELPDKLSAAIKASQEPAVGRIINTFGDDYTYSNGWNRHNGILFHNGTNPNFSTFVLIDVENDTGIYANSNAWVNTPDYAANSLCQIMNGFPINREQLDVPDTIIIVDNISTAAIIICAVMVLVILLLLLTQKRRLARKKTSLKKERVKLRVRLFLLALALVVLRLIPAVLGAISGYGSFSYKMLAVWMPYTLLIAFAMMALVILLAAVSCISGYVIRKRMCISTAE